MNSVSIHELVEGKQYRIYSDGGCEDMRTTLFRTFIEINADGNPLFYDDSMGCPVIYDRVWRFYKI